jgi:uncharacterized protein YjbJ (UPF0337 family)
MRYAELQKEAILMKNNDDVLEKNWRDLRGKLRERWHSLTDEDVTIINGNRSVLVSLLEEKYLYSKDIAEDEVNRFLGQVAAKVQPMPATHVSR